VKVKGCSGLNRTDFVSSRMREVISAGSAAGVVAIAPSFLVVADL
jgi:hypothetical protein